MERFCHCSVNSLYYLILNLHLIVYIHSTHKSLTSKTGQGSNTVNIYFLSMHRGVSWCSVKKKIAIFVNLEEFVCVLLDRMGSFSKADFHEFICYHCLQTLAIVLISVKILHQFKILPRSTTRIPGLAQPKVSKL